MTGDKRSKSDNNNNETKKLRKDVNDNTSSQRGDTKGSLRQIIDVEKSNTTPKDEVLLGPYQIGKAISNMKNVFGAGGPSSSADLLANTQKIVGATSSSSRDKTEKPVDSPKGSGFADGINMDNFFKDTETYEALLKNIASWEEEEDEGYLIEDKKTGLLVKIDSEGKEVRGGSRKITDKPQEQKSSQREAIEALVEAKMKEKVLAEWPDLKGKKLFFHYKYELLRACVKDKVVYITDNQARLTTEKFGMTIQHLYDARKGDYAHGLKILKDVEKAYDHPKSYNGTNIKIELLHAIDHPILEYVGEDTKKQGIHIINQLNCFVYSQGDSDEAKQLYNYLSPSGRSTPPDSGVWIKLEDIDTYEWKDNKWNRKDGKKRNRRKNNG